MLQCPVCKTFNRREADECYYCDQDLKLLKITKNRAMSHFNRAVEFAEKKGYEDALNELLVAVELDQSEPSFFLILGTVYVHLNEPDKARDAWQQGLALDSKYQKLHYNLAKVEHFSVLDKMKEHSKVLGIASVALIVLSVGLLSGYIVKSSSYNSLYGQIEQIASGKFDDSFHSDRESVKILADKMTQYSSSYEQQQEKLNEQVQALKTQQLKDDIEVLLADNLFDEALKLNSDGAYSFSPDQLELIKIWLDQQLNLHFLHYDQSQFQQLAQQYQYSGQSDINAYVKELAEIYNARYDNQKVHELALSMPQDTPQTLEFLKKLDEVPALLNNQKANLLKDGLIAALFMRENQQLQDDLKASRFDDAKQLIAELDAFRPYLTAEELGLIDQMNQDTLLKQSSWLFAAFEKAMNNKDWKNAWNQGLSLQKSPDVLAQLQDEQKLALNQDLTAIQKKLVWPFWQELQGDQKSIFSQKSEAPEQVVEKANLILANLPKRLEYIRDDILFMRANAYLQLKELQSAQLDLQTLSTMKKHPYHKQVKKLLKEM